MNNCKICCSYLTFYLRQTWINHLLIHLQQEIVTNIGRLGGLVIQVREPSPPKVILNTIDHRNCGYRMRYRMTIRKMNFWRHRLPVFGSPVLALRLSGIDCIIDERTSTQLSMLTNHHPQKIDIFKMSRFKKRNWVLLLLCKRA